MSDFLTKLANTSSAPRTSEHLKLLGKRAANAFASGDASNLTDAVRGVVGDEDMTRDQVSRVSELANQEAWKTLFVDSNERQVHFEPADAASVIGELAARPSEVSTREFEDLDFKADVPNQVPSDDVDLAELFGLKGDSPEYEALNPTFKEEQEVQKTASAVGVARYGIDSSASLLAEAGEEFYRLVKHAHLDEGAGILQIAKAVALATADPLFARDCMEKVSARLEADGVKFNKRVEIEKVAHALVVNHEHPLLQAAANLERAAFSYYSANVSHTKLASAHRSASQKLMAKVQARR